MDGQVQRWYPRKNWSSLILFKCSSCSCTELTLEVINSADPKWLQGLEWASEIDKGIDGENTCDILIGSFPYHYNFLFGYYDDIELPNIIHYTDGGPWFKGYEHCDFANEWINFYEKINISSKSGRKSQQLVVRHLYYFSQKLL